MQCIPLQVQLHRHLHCQRDHAPCLRIHLPALQLPHRSHPMHRQCQQRPFCLRHAYCT